MPTHVPGVTSGTSMGPTCSMYARVRGWVQDLLNYRCALMQKRRLTGTSRPFLRDVSHLCQTMVNCFRRQWQQATSHHLRGASLAPVNLSLPLRNPLQHGGSGLPSFARIPPARPLY